MQDSDINKAFNKLVKSCPHGKPNPQCPFEIYRSMNEELFAVAETCSDDNKEIMLNYHKICHRIRSENYAGELVSVCKTQV